MAFAEGPDEYSGTGDYADTSPSSEDMSPGTKALIARIQKEAAKKPPGVSDEDWDKAGDLVAQGINLFPKQPDILTSKHGYFRPNPQATSWDWITGAGEAVLNTIGSVFSGGIASPDIEFTGRDALQYVDPSGRVHSDISQYSQGIAGPQNPGIQVDLGLSPVTAATVSFDQAKGMDINSPIPSAVKAASDYLPDIPGLAAGGLASLPQISQSGLYRAMGRG